MGDQAPPVMPQTPLTVADIGEFGLIDRLRRRFEQGGEGVLRGIGDDTAALQVRPGYLLLATTDALVEGVHFQRATIPARLLGRRALAVNVSDIAAMGGIPRWALVALGLPAETPLPFIDDLVEGLAEQADLHQIRIVGGNLTRSPERLVLDLTLLGEVEMDRAIYRTGARPGDRILVTGTIGDSAAGLAILLGQVPRTVPGADELIARHQLPSPRVEAGRAIALSGLATAMIDVSDGLAGDLGHLVVDNGLGGVVDLAYVPLSPALRAAAVASGRDPLSWALYGGEDYELLLTAPTHRVDALTRAVEATGVSLTAIGEVTAEPGLWLRHPDGQRVPLTPAAWQHFRSTDQTVVRAPTPPGPAREERQGEEGWP